MTNFNFNGVLYGKILKRLLQLVNNVKDIKTRHLFFNINLIESGPSNNVRCVTQKPVFIWLMTHIFLCKAWQIHPPLSVKSNDFHRICFDGNQNQSHDTIQLPTCHLGEVILVEVNKDVLVLTCMCMCRLAHASIFA